MSKGSDLSERDLSERLRRLERLVLPGDGSGPEDIDATLDSAELMNAYLAGTMDARQNSLDYVSDINLGPTEDVYTTVLRSYRGGSLVGAIDNSLGDFRLKAYNSRDLDLMNVNNDGITIDGVTGNLELNWQGIEEVLDIELGPSADAFQTVLRVYRGGTQVGSIDNGGGGYRVKGQNGSDVDIVNSTNLGITIDGGTGHLELNGQSLRLLNKVADPAGPATDSLFYDTTAAQVTYKDPGGTLHRLG